MAQQGVGWFRTVMNPNPRLYVCRDQQIVEGPLTVSEVAALHKTGRLAGGFVCIEGGQNWQTFDEFRRNLMSALPPTAAGLTVVIRAVCEITAFCLPYLLWLSAR